MTKEFFNKKMYLSGRTEEIFMAYRNIVFDMGNVLIEWNPQNIVARFTDDKDKIEKISKALFEIPEWGKLDEGTISEEEVLNIAKSKLPEEYYDDLEEVFDNWHYCLPIISETSNLVKILHSMGYGVYLLSNACKRFSELKKDIHCIKFMNGYMVSSYEKCCKPSKEIYQKFFDKFDLNPSECLFIDDLEANCDGARAVGMDAYRYDGDFEKLVEYLKSQGINL